MVIIILLVIAVIVLFLLTMINVRTISSERETIVIEPESEQVEYLNNPSEQREQDKRDKERVQKAPNTSMDDQSYRKALQSFKETASKEEKKNTAADEKIKDNDYRKALQSISKQK
jgi:hypothetical protein